MRPRPSPTGVDVPSAPEPSSSAAYALRFISAITWQSAFATDAVNDVAALAKP